MQEKNIETNHLWYFFYFDNKFKWKVYHILSKKRDLLLGVLPLVVPAAG